jgi:copper-binding protein NosD
MPTLTPRRLVLSLLALLALLALRAARAAAARKPSSGPQPVVFFVSPHGNDAWSGRRPDPGGKDGPFATLERARAAVRALHRRQTPPRPIRVVLRGGTYFLNRPLLFGPEDSGTPAAPVLYAAAPGETVILSGGRRLPGGRWGQVNGRKAWVVELPAVKARTWRFRQLFVNGERRPRPRLPRQGEYRIEALPGYDPQAGGYAFLAGTRQFVYQGNDIQPWRNLRDVEVIGISRWIDQRLPIQRVEPDRRLVTFDRTSLFTLDESSGRPSVYWVENVLEALDTPGQWYLDRPQGRLYYLPRPGEDMPAAAIIAPRLPQVVQVAGRAGAPVHDLHFERLHFAHTEWQPPAGWSSSLQAAVDLPGALFFDGARRCSVRDCTIEQTGGYAVEVGVGCEEIEIARNRMVDLGAGGVKIGHFFSYEPNERGRRREAAMPRGPRSRRITVADNVIARGGRLVAAGVGVFVGDNPENRVVHNHIFDLRYSGISVGSVQEFKPSHATGNIVEYNHVHDIGQGMLSDIGGIYTNSISPGTRLRYNVVHDVRCREYGGWGIYLDESSSEILVEKNLVYRCNSASFFPHINRDITVVNNIFACGGKSQIERAGNVTQFEFRFERNIVYYNEGTMVGYWNTANRSFACDHNLYWNASGAPITFDGKSLAEWQQAGQDPNSLLADPLFVNPEHGDFRLRPGSPAPRIGFQPWDFSSAGPRPRSP